MTVMDGKSLAAKYKSRIVCEVKELARKPGLAVVIVGDNPASRVYVNSKRKDCQECGIYSEEYALPAQTSQLDLLDLIEVLNGREDIDGILVQLPLPQGFEERKILMAISPQKDVDGFHPMNVGKLMAGESCFQPCTPAGVMALLDEYHIDPAGKHCVVIGRSNIVGKPMSILLLARNGTVTIAHSKTQNLAELCRSADILVSAVGQCGLVTGEMVKPGATVVDVAMNRDENGKLCGDVLYAQAAVKAEYLTPVPGGVGPMTRAMLLQNTLLAARLHQN